MSAILHGNGEIAPLHLRPKQNDQNVLRSIFFINPPLLFSVTAILLFLSSFQDRSSFVSPLQNRKPPLLSTLKMSTDTSTKDTYETYFNGGKFSPSSLPTSRGMLPMCRCLPMKPMIVYIATTLENQGRRFWRCRDWQKKHKTCNEWIWDDELYPATRPMIHCYSAEAESASLNALVIREHESAPLNGPVIREAESAKSGRSANQRCNCGEIWEKKKEKWKMKVLAEKKKVEWLKWIIIATWLIFSVFFVKK